MDTVTNDHTENVIVKEYYDYKPDVNLTLCLLTLKNGFIVHGEAHCLVQGWYDECIGKQRSRANAKDKIWILEAYLLRQKQFECGENPQEAATSRTYNGSKAVVSDV